MRTWDQIDVSAQEAVLLHLRVSMRPHHDMIKDAADADATMGPLANALERHSLMVNAISTAMKFLAGKDLLDTAEWLAVEPVRREFIIGNLLNLYSVSRDNYKNGLENGLTHAAQRFDDIAEAAYVAATTLGWVDPQATKDGTWSILSEANAQVFTAAWSVLGEKVFPSLKTKKTKAQQLIRPPRSALQPNPIKQKPTLARLSGNT